MCRIKHRKVSQIEETLAVIFSPQLFSSWMFCVPGTGVYTDSHCH